MNVTKLLLTVASVSILATSCQQDQGVKQYDYTYTNKTGKDILIDIYPTLQDYNNNTNPYLKGVAVANGGTYVIPSSDFVPEQKYYVDWYSSDYTYTNWQNRQGFYDEFVTAFVPTFQSNWNKLESVNDYARLVFLNGGAATESKWVAVDGVAYPGGNYTEWADLPARYKYRKMTFRKDFSCALYYQSDSSDIILNDKRTFRTPYLGTPQGMNQGMVYINLEDEHNVAITGIATYSIGPINGATGLPTFGDTIVIDMDDNGRYKMVRDTTSAN